MWVYDGFFYVVYLPKKIIIYVVVEWTSLFARELVVVVVWTSLFARELNVPSLPSKFVNMEKIGSTQSTSTSYHDFNIGFYLQ